MKKKIIELFIKVMSLFLFYMRELKYFIMLFFFRFNIFFSYIISFIISLIFLYLTKKYDESLLLNSQEIEEIIINPKVIKILEELKIEKNPTARVFINFELKLLVIYRLNKEGTFSPEVYPIYVSSIKQQIEIEDEVDEVVMRYEVVDDVEILPETYEAVFLTEERLFAVKNFIEQKNTIEIDTSISTKTILVYGLVLILVIIILEVTGN